MGVKLLNKFIRSKCKDKDSIKRISLYNLKHKKIAVDTSIYLYRYEGEKMLYEGFYNMCSLFKKYDIIPIFVFDGKPPKEKEAELKNRREEKRKARRQYKELKQKLRNIDNDEVHEVKDVKEEIEQQMDNLRKKFIKIKSRHIQFVKKIITGFGYNYIHANGESDHICALLSLKQKVYAVMSEDMDMFVFECPRIIRYFSLSNHNCVVYNYSKIISELNLSKKQFKELCILSGTDYLKTHKSDMNIFQYYKKIIDNKLQEVIEYFIKYTDEKEVLDTIKNLYNVMQNELLMNEIMDIDIINKEMQYDELKELMDYDNFIFV